MLCIACIFLFAHCFKKLVQTFFLLSFIRLFFINVAFGFVFYLYVLCLIGFVLFFNLLLTFSM